MWSDVRIVCPSIGMLGSVRGRLPVPMTNRSAVTTRSWLLSLPSTNTR